MALLALDLGGTKLATAVFTEEGKMLSSEVTLLEHREGPEVGELIASRILSFLAGHKAVENGITSIGISVPGIYHVKSGRAWAPNIPGWEDYPLLSEIKNVAGELPVTIDSDRACYILGEVWKGNAGGCSDAIFLAVGTGIGAGILVEGKVLRGAHDIAGAIGWMALQRPFDPKFISCGCFEHFCSGEGIAKLTQELLDEESSYSGVLRKPSGDSITSHEVFSAYGEKDPLAVKAIHTCIEFWGMASANLVSLFNPEKIIFGGGIFGPAIPLIPLIKEEAARWAQPISMRKVIFEPSGLGSHAGLYGAGFLALKNVSL